MINAIFFALIGAELGFREPYFFMCAAYFALSFVKKVVKLDMHIHGIDI